MSEEEMSSKAVNGRAHGIGGASKDPEAIWNEGDRFGAVEKLLWRIEARAPVGGCLIPAPAWRLAQG